MSPLLFLEQLIRHGRTGAAELSRAETTWGLQHAVTRLAASLKGTGFGLDQAILLRQCLRLLTPGQSIVLDRVSSEVEKHFSAVGLQRGIDGIVEAKPFMPSWLNTPASHGVDTPAATE